MTASENQLRIPVCHMDSAKIPDRRQVLSLRLPGSRRITRITRKCPATSTVSAKWKAWSTPT